MTVHSVNALLEWVSRLGLSGETWLRGDFHVPMSLLAKLLHEQLRQKMPAATVHVAFKMRFDVLAQLAEECLGIPCIVTERDLLLDYPNIHLALFVYMICIRHTLSACDPKTIKKQFAPKLIFEVRNGADAHFPRCPSCDELIFFVERLVIDAAVYHRHCFKCSVCSTVITNGAYKKGRRGYECLSHAVRKVLQPEVPKSPRPAIAPPPVPMSTPLSCTTNSKPIVPPKPARTEVPPPVQPKPRTIFTNTADRVYDEVIDVPPPPLPPVAPPRPKRASILLQQQKALVDEPETSSPSVSRKLSIASGTSNKSSTLYPSTLCPFEDLETDVAFEYDESKNPFADSDEDEGSFSSSDLQPSISPAPSLSCDRPKSQPPPPPVPATPQQNVEADESQSLSNESDRFKTLRISRKTVRAPLIPTLKRREIGFTNNKEHESTAVIEGKISALYETLERLERDGKTLEVELLFMITQNPKDWYKLQKCDEMVGVMMELLDTTKDLSLLQFRWREAYLNEIHAETEFLLRLIVEGSTSDAATTEREKELTNLLLYIIDEKAKMTENSAGSLDDTDIEKATRDERKKYKKRLAILSKRKKSKLLP